ncbi:monovalent cation/H+ antiporter subunit D [Candidatus Thioglobus sp.]|uniref:monovalent cation/H+ antiporter subunit D n=1 Tax=Candidatus Thioglobus sp. TaxID=2026721 RepID=UPI003D0A84B5
MMHLAAWPVFLPLIAGFVILLAKVGGLQWRRAINLLAVLGLVVLSFLLIKESSTGNYQVYLLGNWQAPFGIVLVLDRLSALMIATTSLLALAALVYTIATDTDKKGAHFHVLFQLLLFGLNGAFLTGDVFNLFVFFEVLLLASYGLLLHGGGRLRTKAGLHYVIINLLGATLFLFAVGTLYGILGTLNIADMANKIALLPKDDLGIVGAAGLLLLIVFGIKAALFPLYLWMPIAYTHTSAAVAAMFAIMTKVGIYAIIRVHGTIFGDGAGDLANYYVPWILGLGLLTLILAAFGVMAGRGLREQVAYLVLASVATLLIGVGLNSTLALSGSLYYLIHSSLIAGGLFLLAGIITRGRGHFKDRFESGYALPSAVLIGSLFMFAAVAMTGMPPLSGFFGKVLILSAALDHQWAGLILAVVLVAGLIMIISMARSGSLLFYQTIDNETQNETNKPLADVKPVNRIAVIVVIGLFTISPLLVIFAKPITTFTESAAKQQFDNKSYIEAVLSKQAVTAFEQANKEVL